MTMPTIGLLEDQVADFHDSELVAMEYVRKGKVLRMTLVTEWLGALRAYHVDLWDLLQLDLSMWPLDTVTETQDTVEVYDVYVNTKSPHARRWNEHMKVLGTRDRDAWPAICVMFASSSASGWAETEELDGIRVVCRGFEISPARSHYLGHAYTKLADIEAGGKDDSLRGR